MLRFAILLAVVAAIVEALRRMAQPEADTAPAAPTPWTPLEPSSGSGNGATAGTTVPTSPAETPAETPVPEPAPEAAATPPPERDTSASPWVGGDAEGTCPASHPLKAKDSSKIVHQPGGLSYDRTHADRCYVDLAAAEADGYRAAKR
jgi:hypothetical protein